MRKEIVPIYLQHFIVGVLVTVLFPMLPLFVEYRYNGCVSVLSLYIAAIMYVSAISLSYENIAVFYFGALAALFLAIDYGRLFSNNAQTDPSGSLPISLMIAFGIMQVVKCYDLHINQKENFVYFRKVTS